MRPQGVLPATWSRRLGIVRAFARHQHALDPRTQVPPRGLLVGHYRRRVPAIIPEESIARLVDELRRTPSATGLRPQSYSFLVGLIAATGMRTSEATHLGRDDVDFGGRTVLVRRGKRGAWRLLPIDASTVGKLRQYATERDRLVRRPISPAFFISDRGRSIADSTLRRVFCLACRAIDLRSSGERPGVRLLDLRHTFAVDVLRRWYLRGVDVERSLPLLSTYLGHTRLEHTYWYLSAVPELLQLASFVAQRTWIRR
jgi:integrase